MNKTCPIRGVGLIEAGAYFCFCASEIGVYLKGVLIGGPRIMEEMQYFNQKSLSCLGNDSHRD